MHGEWQLLLAVLGEVFDVSKGAKHYAPGMGYSFFTGRDGSRAFVTGDFTEAGLVDDLTGLSPTDVRAHLLSTSIRAPTHPPLWLYSDALALDPRLNPFIRLRPCP